MIYEKLYNEIYALLSIGKIGSEYRGLYTKSESPDWVNEGKSIGIEVTQALLQYEGEAQKVIDKYLGKRLEEIPYPEIEPFMDRARFFCGRLQAIDTENGAQSYIFKTLYRFDKKLMKLNTNYSLLKTNCLYIFLHSNGEIYSDIEHIFERIQAQQKRKKYRFHTVFLNCIDTIYELHPYKSTIKTVDITEFEQKELADTTLLLRNRAENSEEVIKYIEI